MLNFSAVYNKEELSILDMVHMYPDLMDIVEKTSNCEIFKFSLRDKTYILKPNNIKRAKEAYLIITGRFIDENGLDVDLSIFKKIFPEAEKYI